MRDSVDGGEDEDGGGGGRACVKILGDETVGEVYVAVRSGIFCFIFGTVDWVRLVEGGSGVVWVGVRSGYLFFWWGFFGVGGWELCAG